MLLFTVAYVVEAILYRLFTFEGNLIAVNSVTWSQTMHGEWLVAFVDNKTDPVFHTTIKNLAYFISNYNNISIGLGYKEDADLATRFEIEETPSIVHINNGVVRRYQGGVTAENLIEYVKDRYWQLDKGAQSIWQQPDGWIMSAKIALYRLYRSQSVWLAEADMTLPCCDLGALLLAVFLVCFLYSALDYGTVLHLWVLGMKRRLRKLLGMEPPLQQTKSDPSMMIADASSGDSEKYKKKSCKTLSSNRMHAKDTYLKPNSPSISSMSYRRSDENPNPTEQNFLDTISYSSDNCSSVPFINSSIYPDDSSFCRSYTKSCSGSQISISRFTKTEDSNDQCDTKNSSRGQSYASFISKSDDSQSFTKSSSEGPTSKGHLTRIEETSSSYNMASLNGRDLFRCHLSQFMPEPTEGLSQSQLFGINYWQVEIAQKFGLPIHKVVNANLLTEIHSKNPKEIVDITKDGNSLFSCLSYVISGSEKYHSFMRLVLTSFMVEMHSRFQPLLKMSVNDYLRSTKMSCDGVPGSVHELLAFTELTKTDVRVFNGTNGSSLLSKNRTKRNRGLLCLVKCKTLFQPIVLANAKERA